MFARRAWPPATRLVIRLVIGLVAPSVALWVDQTGAAVGANLLHIAAVRG